MRKEKKTHCDLINQYFKKILFSFCSIYTAYGIMNNIWINIYTCIYKHTIGIVQCQVHVCNKDTEV